MTKLSAWKMAFAVFVLCAATAIAAPSQVFTTVATFYGGNGEEPNPPHLVEGTDGSLYGTTETGGSGSSGTIFKLTRGGVLKTLYNFSCNQNTCTGNTPTGLIVGTNGILYGTTYTGGGSSNCPSGCGTVFQITQQGTLTILHNFASTDGADPAAGVIEGIDGNFYGTTNYGGANGDGTVFKITPSGTLTTLYSFGGVDGSIPVSGLVQAIDGDFYGTTAFGGRSSRCEDGCGTVFKITPKGAVTTLHSFCVRAGCTDGEVPMAALSQDADGNFYSTTYYGGANNECESGCGTIFTITPKGTLTTLYSFCSVSDCADGIGPSSGIVVATDRRFYGTTSLGGAMYNDGTVFSIDSSGTLTTLHTFDYFTDGAEPGGLVQATNGTFYGTTYTGGSGRQGTLYSLNMNLDPFVTFVIPAGRVGEAGGILGQGFTGTTSVMLNGVPANFTVVSDTYIKATVPSGATTGYVTVTTPSGALTSNEPFHVIK
jgi:uncharacterized repeat protein (TIGR03803 family)